MDDRHLENSKNHNISAMEGPILTKFGTVMRISPPNTVSQDNAPLTFAARIRQGVQQNSNSTSQSDISRPRVFTKRSVSNFFPQKSMELDVVIITPEML